MHRTIVRPVFTWPPSPPTDRRGGILALLALVRAAAATAMPDIEERLSRFEWDRMNLADLTGMLQA